MTGCSSVSIKRTEEYRVGDKERGKATWYGKEFHGVMTATKKEKFDMYAMTAAHKRIPFDSKVKVTNLANKKSVIVRINDRGPSKQERVVDLSYGAFSRIPDPEKGIIDVEIEVLKLGED